jgi:hypothetical protein
MQQQLSQSPIYTHSTSDGSHISPTPHFALRSNLYSSAHKRRPTGTRGGHPRRDIHRLNSRHSVSRRLCTQSKIGPVDQPRHHACKPRYDRTPEVSKQPQAASDVRVRVAPSLADTLADCARPRAQSHHHFSTVENRSRRPTAPPCVQASVWPDTRGLSKQPRSLSLPQARRSRCRSPTLSQTEPCVHGHGHSPTSVSRQD